MDLLDATNFALDRIFDSSNRAAVSSAIPVEPQQPMCRYPDLVEGSSPCADARTASVGDSSRVLIEQYRRTNGEYERAFRRLKALLDQDDLDNARDIVVDILRGIDGPSE